MPFTFSHPAVVLPVRSRLKKWIPLSALVVGSLVPDAAYYLPMPEHFKQNAHTLLGTFSSSLPLGILVLLILYWIAAPAVFLLPSPHREALQPELATPPETVWQAVLVGFGIVIGAWSHVLWDSCTHDTGWIVRHSSMLRDPFLGHTIAAYIVLQYFSTVLGISVLLYAYGKWMNARGFQPWTLPRPCWRFYLWLGIAIACSVAAIIESHAIHAIATFPLVHSKRFALVFFTSFVRDMLLAICVLSIGARAVGVRSPREMPRETLP